MTIARIQKSTLYVGIICLIWLFVTIGVIFSSDTVTGLSNTVISVAFVIPSFGLILLSFIGLLVISVMQMKKNV